MPDRSRFALITTPVEIRDAAARGISNLYAKVDHIHDYSRDLAIGLDGASHLYVSTTGSDNNSGQSSRNPFRTINRAVQRAKEWLLLNKKRRLVIHLAAGTYAQNVELKFLAERQVILTGPRLGTIVHSGSITAASAISITDAGAAFGATNGLADGRWIRIYDPADPANTEQFKTIRSNTGTVLNPNSAFFPTPSIGWTYEVHQPSALISGDPSDTQHPTLDIAPGWIGQHYDGTFQPDGPAMLVAFLRVSKAAGSVFSAVRIRGGNAQFAGVIIEGAPFTALEVVKGGLATGIASFAADGDPVFAIPAGSFGMFDLAFGIRGTAFTGLRMDYGTFAGSFVVHGPAAAIFLVDHASLSLYGAVYDGSIDIGYQSQAFMDAGGDPALPLLCRNAGIQIRDQGSLDVGSGGIGGLRFEANVADALRVINDGFLRLRVAEAPAAGDIAGSCVVCTDGGSARIGPAITDAAFPSTGSRIAVDGATGATWAAMPSYLEDVAPGTRQGSRAWKS